MNKENSKENKIKEWIGKRARMLILFVFIVSIIGYYIYINSSVMGLSKPELRITVSTNLSEVGTPMINNATFEQSGVPFFYKTTDSPADFPEIDVNIRINKLSSAPASYWASTPYKGEGKYTLRLFFRDGQYPKKGDVLIISIRMASSTGAIMYKTTAFWVWE